MPVEKRGVLFRYFDKAILGIVVVGLLLTLAYVVTRTGSASEQVDLSQVQANVDRIQRALQEAPPELTVPNYEGQVAQLFGEQATPATVRPYLINMPHPESYVEFRVGPDKDFTLEFNEPLARGSVEVTGDEALARVLEHPVGIDYRKVKLHSANREGQARVSGTTASGNEHIYPVVVDAAVGKTAYPPVELAVGDQLEQIMLEWQPDPRIATDEVDVVQYQVWRRDWNDPLGEYKEVGGLNIAGGRSVAYGGGVPRASAGRDRRTDTMGPPAGMIGMDPSMMDPSVMFDPSLGGGPPGAMGGGPPGGFGGTRPRTRRGTEETAVETMQWQDFNVEPGARYSYKVRTVGSNTFPGEGEFTEPIRVEVHPSFDIKFTSVALDRVNIQVAKGSIDANGNLVAPSSAAFYVSRGGEIGGVTEPTAMGQVENYLTDYMLLDYHRAVRRPEGGVSSRIIYVDEDGRLRVRWQNETESRIWDSLVSRTGRGRRMR